MKKLQDQEKAVLTVFLADKGWPRGNKWSSLEHGVQVQVMARLFDWTFARAEKALKRAKQSGYLSV